MTMRPFSSPLAGSIRGRGHGVDGEPGQARVVGALDQRQVMVRVDLEYIRLQRFGQFSLLGGAHQPVAGRDEHGCGQAQVSCPRPGVVPAERAPRTGELGRQTAAELSDNPRPEFR
jgi:hypothetical protein